MLIQLSRHLKSQIEIQSSTTTEMWTRCIHQMSTMIQSQGHRKYNTNTKSALALERIKSHRRTKRRFSTLIQSKEVRPLILIQTIIQTQHLSTAMNKSDQWWWAARSMKTRHQHMERRLSSSIMSWRACRERNRRLIRYSKWLDKKSRLLMFPGMRIHIMREVISIKKSQKAATKVRINSIFRRMSSIRTSTTRKERSWCKKALAPSISKCMLLWECPLQQSACRQSRKIHLSLWVSTMQQRIPGNHQKLIPCRQAKWEWEVDSPIPV